MKFKTETTRMNCVRMDRVEALHDVAAAVWLCADGHTDTYLRLEEDVE